MIFKTEDFINGDGHILARTCAQVANAKLKKLIDESPTVSSYSGFDDWFDADKKDAAVKFKGKIMFIEELPKEPCKHSVAMSKMGAKGKWELATESDGKIRCGVCNAEVVAEWKAK